ncbi:MAG: hypothetical protein PUP91_31025 [Rhizonema sp. PD37]|nr:hypothetical protein [Rhizonema sp. PD37]
MIKKILFLPKVFWLLIFIVLPFFGLVLYNNFANNAALSEKRESDRSRCYDRVSEKIATVEGDKGITRDDIERYGSVMVNTCH